MYSFGSVKKSIIEMSMSMVDFVYLSKKNKNVYGRFCLVVVGYVRRGIIYLSIIFLFLSS